MSYGEIEMGKELEQGFTTQLGVTVTGHHDEAVKYFKASLDQSIGKLPQESMQYALIEMTDSLKVTGDVESAKKSANEALNLSKPDSLSRHQAEAKILMLESESPEQLERLKAMEANARSKGWISHANDLRLMMQSEIKDFDEKIKCLDIVLNSEDDGEWNKYRAIVEKCILLVRSKRFERIAIHDRVSLQQAYSYCYSQRINMFDRCHEAIWSILENESRYEQLCRLFLHSSFIWRIRGDVEIETRYFERLHAHREQLANNTKTIFIEIRYFTKRSKVLLARIASLSKNKE